MREIRSPITPEENHESDQAFLHMDQRQATLPQNHPIKMRMRCNQVASDMRSMCDYDAWVETTLGRAEKMAARVLREHFIMAHPSLTDKERETLIGRRIMSLRDLPTLAPRRALT